MTAADIVTSAELIVRGGWGDRREFFAWAVDHPGASPIVADLDGRVVGTGVGSVHGLFGWVGTIFVEEALRGQGLGGALTRRVIDDLERAGCSTLVLIATELGRPIYERLGFTVQSRYHMLYTTGLADGADVADVDPRIRSYEPADLTALVTLDAAATGEDRSAVIASFVERGRAVVATDDDGTVVGFIVRPPWGGGAVVAPDPADAIRLLDWRRRSAGPDGQVGAGVPTENEAGRALLAGRGWEETVAPVRMVRGVPPAWQPTAIWGQFGGPLG
jgi:predicted N-acetyltransferase YhbS